MGRYTVTVTILMMMSSGSGMPCTLTIERLDVSEITALITVLAKANKLYKMEIRT